MHHPSVRRVGGAASAEPTPSALAT
jgi:hypothetical protein